MQAFAGSIESDLTCSELAILLFTFKFLISSGYPVLDIGLRTVSTSGTGHPA